MSSDVRCDWEKLAASCCTAVAPEIYFASHVMRLVERRQSRAISPVSAGSVATTSLSLRWWSALTASKRVDVAVEERLEHLAVVVVQRARDGRVRRAPSTARVR